MGSKPESGPSKDSSIEEIIPGYTSIEQFTKDGFKTCMEAIRHANALPVDRDLDYYKLSDSFKRIITDEGNNVLTLMNRILKYNDVDSNIKNKILEEKTELVIEANDVILEKVGNNIDEMNGIRKTVPEALVLQTVSAQFPVNGSWNRPNEIIFSVNSSSAIQQDNSDNCIRLITAKNIIRPQKFFKDKIDNSNSFPWEPRIKDKPNSLKPLAIFLEECDNRHEYSHPYEYELDRFVPGSEQLLEETPEQFKPLAETDLIEIDKPEQLDELVETLRNCKEFAVDLEHHSYRSFMGITCLLQISTKNTDYLIDTLALRDKLHVLNEVFTKNSIVKIFHGADSDVEWLQRDLSIYVVNLFDTHQAAKVLEFSGLSLAYLMKKYCNVNPNKKFQLADWRMRPLLDELKHYAREDTHYLIYIYQMLKKELIAKANNTDKLVRVVIDRSTEICKKRYFKPILTEDSYLNIYRKCKKMFNNQQMYALKEIYAWRDKIAREEDESLQYVLPNHMVLQISESLPREMQGILACCNPIPPLIKSHLLDLHHIILKARDQPLEVAILKNDTAGRGILKRASKINVDSPLHCPHDLSKMNEFRDDLPTLLSNNNAVLNKSTENSVLKIEKTSSMYSVFEALKVFDKNKSAKLKSVRGMGYLSPYERYQLVKPFVAEEQKKQEEEEAKAKLANEDNRTNEERIEAIRDHFMEMSKKFTEDLELKKKQEAEQEQTLLQMSGSRKRKREQSESDVNLVESPDKKFRSPRPDFNRNQAQTNWRYGRKRKFQDANQQNHNNDPPQAIPNKNTKKNKNKQKKKQLQQQQQRQQELNQETLPNQQQPKNKKKKKNKQLNNSRQDALVSAGGFLKPPWAKSKKTPTKKKPQAQRENNDFTPYDYASVDFRQFQGGAGSARSGAQIKPAFKGKNQKKMGNKNTRSSTFNNSNRGGRGRGR